MLQHLRNKPKLLLRRFLRIVQNGWSNWPGTQIRCETSSGTSISRFARPVASSWRPCCRKPPKHPLVRQQAVVPTKAPRADRSQFRLLCGVVLYVSTLSCPPKPSCRKDPGRADAEQRTGLFPELAAFGIGIGCTPCMMQTVARTVAINPSMDVARRELAQQGIRLDKKTDRRAVRPRAFDERGRMVSRHRQPLIDGTLFGPDHTAQLVAYHLHRFGAARAERVVFLADGGRWIWDRIDWIVKRAGIDSERVQQVLDFCHAAHHISLALEALSYAGDERKTEYRRLRKQLKAGRWEAVTADLIALAFDAPDDSDVWTEIDDLFNHGNAGRLAYSRFRREGLPSGSGAIESTIRRVINLRLKSNGMFWMEENAEAIFAVRALWLSERWDETLVRVRSSMSTDRRRNWKWEAPDVLQELNTTCASTIDSQEHRRLQKLTRAAA